MSSPTDYQRTTTPATRLAARILPVARLPECFGSGTYRYFKPECRRCASRPLVGSGTHSLRSACVSAAAGGDEVIVPRPVTASEVVETEPSVFAEAVSPEAMARLVRHFLGESSTAYAPEIIASLKKTIRKIHAFVDELPPALPKSKPVRAALTRLRESRSADLDPKSSKENSRGFPGDEALKELKKRLKCDPRVQNWEEVKAPFLSRHVEELRRRGRIGAVSREAHAIVLGLVATSSDPTRTLDALKPLLFVPQARNAWRASAHEIGRYPTHEASRRLVACLEAFGRASVPSGDHFSPAKVIRVMLQIPVDGAEAFVGHQIGKLKRPTMASVFTSRGLDHARRILRGVFRPPGYTASPIRGRVRVV